MHRPPVPMKPDFSGEYVLDRPACALSPGADAFHSATLRLDHREPVFRCSAHFAADDKTSEYSFELGTDGRDVTGPSGEAGRMYWDGDALVNEFRSTTPDGPLTMVWRYELLDGGRRLRATEKLQGPGRHQHNVWEFDRRQA